MSKKIQTPKNKTNPEQVAPPSETPPIENPALTPPVETQNIASPQENTENLSDFLNLATEQKTFIPPKPTVNTGAEKKTEPAPGTEKPAEEKIHTPSSADFSAEVKPLAEKPKVPLLSPKQNAEITVAGIDTLQTLLFPMGYRRKIFTKDEREKFRIIQTNYEQIRKQRKTPDEFSGTEQYEFAKFEEYTELVNKLPFSKDETKHLETTMEGIIIKYGAAAGPEVMFIMALIGIIGTRCVPFLDR
jgi:hypothetical protein